MPGRHLHNLNCKHLWNYSSSWIQLESKHTNFYLVLSDKFNQVVGCHWLYVMFCCVFLLTYGRDRTWFTSQEASHFSVTCSSPVLARLSLLACLPAYLLACWLVCLLAFYSVCFCAGPFVRLSDYFWFLFVVFFWFEVCSISVLLCVFCCFCSQCFCVWWPVRRSCQARRHT